MRSNLVPTAERLEAPLARADMASRMQRSQKSASDGRLVWDVDGHNWPHHDASRCVRAAEFRWHVQDMGSGPAVLLLHGTGASTHSWRHLMPLLATHFRVIAVDLPGHGFSETPPREFLSMFGMALAVQSLLRQLGVEPRLVVGHSAGAAVAVRMSIDGRCAPDAIVGLNAALLPLRGLAGHIFSPLAKLLARVPTVARLFARRAFDRSMIETMLSDTGSKLDREGVDLYWRLAQSPAQIAAAFAMMAEWDLPRLERDLRRLRTSLALVAASNDRTISPSEAERVRHIVPDTTVLRVDGLGHLAHEERPELVADMIIDVARRAGFLAGRE
jgi:magnesium chelatase accessory protein